MELRKDEKLFHSRRNNQPDEERAHRMGEDLYLAVHRTEDRYPEYYKELKIHIVKNQMTHLKHKFLSIKFDVGC